MIRAWPDQSDRLLVAARIDGGGQRSARWCAQRRWFVSVALAIVTGCKGAPTPTKNPDASEPDGRVSAPAAGDGAAAQAAEAARAAEGEDVRADDGTSVGPLRRIDRRQDLRRRLAMGDGGVGPRGEGHPAPS